MEPTKERLGSASSTGQTSMKILYPGIQLILGFGHATFAVTAALFSARQSVERLSLAAAGGSP